MQKQALTRLLQVLSLLVMIVLPVISTSAYAADFDREISPEDKATFDEMLEPLLKVYSLVKYVATFIAVLVLLFAAINFMTSGANPGKREVAKNMAMYVVIGLVVIWAAPLAVQYIL